MQTRTAFELLLATCWNVLVSNELCALAQSKLAFTLNAGHSAILAEPRLDKGIAFPQRDHD